MDGLGFSVLQGKFQPLQISRAAPPFRYPMPTSMTPKELPDTLRRDIDILQLMITVWATLALLSPHLPISGLEKQGRAAKIHFKRPELKVQFLNCG